MEWELEIKDGGYLPKKGKLTEETVQILFAPIRQKRVFVISCMRAKTGDIQEFFGTET